MNRYGLGVKEQRWTWSLLAALNAGLGRCRRLVDLPALAAAPREHVERQLHLRLRPRQTQVLHACWRRMDTRMAFPYPREPAEQAPCAPERSVAARALSM